MNYSLLRSKTFWTLVVTCVVAVGNILIPVIPMGYQAVATTLLLMLASYFHLQTGNSTTGSN